MEKNYKFRAWDGKRMTTSGIMFNTSTGCLEVPTQASFGGVLTTPYKLMQYTGLKDRNGKEIYEGDLLNIGVIEFGFVTDHDNKLVKYEVCLFGVEYVLYRTDLKLDWGRLSRIEEIMWQCEICGNIYETPELLQTN